MSADSDIDVGAYRSTLPGVLGRVDELIGAVEVFVLAAGVLLMALNTVANVLARFVFRNSLFFSEELNQILIVTITFAGIGYAARHGRHIRMSALYDALPASARKPAMIVIAWVTAVVMFALAWFSVGYIASVASSGRLLASLQIPVWWMYVWVPVGFFVTGVQYALTGVANLTRKGIYLSAGMAEEAPGGATSGDDGAAR